MQILDVKGVRPLFSVCVGNFACQIHEDKTLSFRRAARSFRPYASTGHAPRPCYRVIDAQLNSHYAPRAHNSLQMGNCFSGCRGGRIPGRSAVSGRAGFWTDSQGFHRASQDVAAIQFKVRSLRLGCTGTVLPRSLPRIAQSAGVRDSIGPTRWSLKSENGSATLPNTSLDR